ncbi:regulatory protein RecX [Glaciibacter psychrotolerans]|uniref:Regulatory protein RecX n=1 Tax=Glaciibacter psychrotolerans TaxID=670054 RepID=A0A7Z0EC10_9MICO|nr:regulatory protein RecX [Leifsonia psychrotolerans]NYJ18415.1 SOS response regulatory protein OraA/RecX [Leifsonia psychrotolerans]
MVHFEPVDDTSTTPGLAPVTYLRSAASRSTPGAAPAEGVSAAGEASAPATGDEGSRPVRALRSMTCEKPEWYLAAGGAEATRASSQSTSRTPEGVANIDVNIDVNDNVNDNVNDDVNDGANDGANNDVRDVGEAPLDQAEERERAEQLLLRRLRSRSLSRAEAGVVLAGTDIDADEVDEILERFAELHYIDEERLADQIIHSHHERKGLGRSGVESEMRRRKLDPFLIEEKLEELPDDETERAVELACARIRQLDRFDDQTIDRRLTGFLLRKGYDSAAVRVAITAALASRRAGGRAPGVRFR